MAEKKQRRERLSARDHNRAGRTADAMLTLLVNLQQQYPGDVDLTMADRGLRMFAQRAYEWALVARPAPVGHAVLDDADDRG